MMGADWMVACMIPKSNMMASMLKKVEDGEGFNLVNLKCSEKTETPEENKEFQYSQRRYFFTGMIYIMRILYPR